MLASDISLQPWVYDGDALKTGIGSWHAGKLHNRPHQEGTCSLLVFTYDISSKDWLLV
jgi:hypothetical protein